MPNDSIALRDLALAPGMLAAHASALISGVRVPPPPALLEYAQSLRTLLRHWWRAVQGSTADAPPTLLAALAEEILVTEITCRVVAGVFAVCDARGGRRAVLPFARAALLDLMQAKHSVLSGLVNGPQPLGALLRINQLRRKTERWCDCLLGSLPDNHVAEPFAVSAERMRQFTHTGTAAGSQAARYLALVSLRLSIPGTLIEDEERCRTHRRLVQTLMGFWPADAFDSDGLLRGPLWQRLRGLTDTPPLPGQFPVPPVAVDELEVIRRRFRPHQPMFDDDEPFGGLAT